MIVRSVLFVALMAAIGGALAAPVVINFDSPPSPPIGALPGGPDARTPGNMTTWHVPDNAATSGEVRAGVGLAGSNGLVIGHRDNGNEGVIDNVKSPRLAQAAGESIAPVNATNSIFQSSYWFRTADTQAHDGFAFKSESYGPDRTTYFGAFYQTAAGDTSLNAGAYDIVGDHFVWHPIAQNLNWGAWYQVVTQINFVDGSSNDVVNQYLYDATNSLVGSALGLNSWEQGARDFKYNNSSIFAVDSIQFQARGNGFNGDVAFVDNVSLEALNGTVPEPGTFALLGLGMLGLAGMRRKS